VSEENADEKLRAAFGALKREDAKKVPSFRAMADKPAPARKIAAIYPVVGGLAVAAAVLAVWIGGKTSQRSAAPSSASMQDQPVAAATTAHAAAPAATAAATANATDSPATPARRDALPLDFLLDSPRGQTASLDFLLPEPTP
jgi:hypothetical protein